MHLQDSFGIFEKLYHPQPNIRQEAIRHLTLHYETLKDRQKERIRSYILDRLADDNPDVVAETLGLSKSMLLEIVEEDKLKGILISLAKKSLESKDTWWKISKNVIEVLCTNYDKNDVKVFLTVLQFLLPTSKDELVVAKTILDTNYGKQCVFLQPIRKQLESTTNSSIFLNTIYKSLPNVKLMIDMAKFIQTIKEMPLKDCSALQKYLILLILTHFLPENCDSATGTLVVEIFLLYLKDCPEENNAKKLSKPKKAVVYARTTNKLPLHCFAMCIQIVTARIKKLEASLGVVDLYNANDEGLFCVTLLKFLIKLLHLDKTSLETFDTCIKMLCPNLLQRTEFLLNFSIAPRQDIDSTLRVLCMDYVLNILRKNHDQLKEFVSFSSVTVPYILILASNVDSKFRELSLLLMTALLQGKSADNYGFLLHYMIKHKEEYHMDNEQVPTLLAKVFNEPNDVRNNTLKALILLTHNTNYPLYLNAEMLHLLQSINNVQILSKTSVLALRLLENEATNWDSVKSQVIYRNITRFDSSIAADLELNTPLWKFIELCLKNEQVNIEYDTGKTSLPSVLMMNQITRETFDYLQPQVKTVLLDTVITIATTTQNPEVLTTANRIFKHIDLDVSLVFDQLHKMRDVKSPKQIVKKRRVSVLPTVDILEMIEWRKGVTVLEFIQNKKKMQNTGTLLPVLFEILKKCLDFDEQASVEYPKQLVLSSILHCRNKTEDEEVPENVFDVELIVQCIRASQNPQTHHHALLLLASVASLVPTQVLHHIMAIFTFMGSSVLRHDDAYSFQIITKIIDTVVPVLIQTGNDKQQIRRVLRVFVDVLLDVPEHRRLPLYKQLLERIDARENLHLFFLLVFEAHVLHSSGEKQKNVPNISVDLAPKRLDIAADLSGLFSPEIQLYSCLKVIQYLQTLPVEKGDHMEIDVDVLLFNISTHTPKQFRHYKYTIVLFISNLLSSNSFVSQVAELSNEELLSLEGLYKDLIVNTLTYIQNTAKIVDRNINTQQAQFWKAMLHYSYEILDSINALLTPQMFLLVMKGLMTHSFATVRKRALELLNTKLQNASSFFEEVDLSSLIPPLIDIVKIVSNEEIEPENEVIVQTALLSLKLLVRKLAGDNPQRYVSILNFIIDLVKPGKINDNILASLVLCLAELVVNLRAHAIPGLNKYVPAVIKILKAEKRDEQKPSLLLLCAVTALQKIIDTLPLFLSPYLEKILFELSVLTSRFETENQDQATVPLTNKLKTIIEVIGTSILQRVLIPAIESSYNTLIDKRRYSCVGALMNILAQSLSNLKGNDIQTSLPQLTTFFLHALELRADVDLSCEEIETIENQIVKALTVLILKLSENSFRPLYYKLYDWAIRGSEKSERVITFYCLSHGIAECLKGLFILFAGHFINNAASVLDACNAIKNESLYFEEQDKNLVLLQNVLKTLNSVFLYDTQTFINKDRFDVLMQPIVDQLENTLGGIEILENRARDILIPCIVNFAVATANDALWKQMNYQILLKMRHTSPKIRLIALECLTGVAKRLGEDFLPLLPETIPFLAELLEDEDENVEKACEKVVQELEKVLGEPLKKYF